MSLRLNNYENVEKKDFKINFKKRNNFLLPEKLEIQEKQINDSFQKNSQLVDKNKQKNERYDDTKTLNPLSSYEEFLNKKQSNKSKVQENTNTNSMNIKTSQNLPNQFFNSMPSNNNPRPPQSFMYSLYI